MARRRPHLFFYFICAFALLLWSFCLEAEAKKAIDPYKVLGVEKSANQRDIQKAFHKLSLKYHPDKNKSKGAQEKFAEINNAYEILSDEDKRKNFDLYGDEKGRPEFDGGNYAGGNFGGPGGYTFFTSSGPSNSHFDGRTGGWSGGPGDSFFSFSGDSFGFDLGDVFNMFGNQPKGGGKSGGFSSYGRPNHRSGSTNIQNINSQKFKKEVVDSGLTWLLLFYNSPSKSYQLLESIVEDIVNSLAGAVKAGSINCEKERALCKDLGVWPLKSARLFIYSYGKSETGSLIEYASDFDSRSLKNFCQEHLPRLSKRVSLRGFEFSSDSMSKVPQVLLLSSKKDTPVLWRTLSGLYRNRFIFYDAQVLDAKDPFSKGLGVDALPAVVGRLENGDVHVLTAGITIKDLQTGLAEMRVLLDNFEKKNKNVASTSNPRSQPSPNGQGKGIPFLSSENMDTICGEKVAVCIVGSFRSSKAKEKLNKILSEVSQKTLIRRRIQDQDSRYSIRYALLDANEQSTFLKSFDKSGFKNLEQVLLAYKPRRGKFAALTSEITMETAEGFISSVLNGDVQFSKTRHSPMLK